MTIRPRVIIPWFPGTNCHKEMARAFELAGAIADVVTIHDLASKRRKLSDTDLIGFAGGFSYGDHFRSGVFAAHDLTTLLRDELLLARQKKIPMLGVCNGFQTLVEAGLLPGDGEIGKPTAVLDINVSDRFEHWSEVLLYFRCPKNAPCVWTTGLDGASFTLPSAHHEGLLIPKTSGAFIVVATYGTPEGDGRVSPNGGEVAGITSGDGTVTGFMPHPERRIDPICGGDQGLAIFKSGVNAVL